MVEMATMPPTDIFCVLVTVVVYTCFILGDMHVGRERRVVFGDVPFLSVPRATIFAVAQVTAHF